MLVVHCWQNSGKTFHITIKRAQKVRNSDNGPHLFFHFLTNQGV